MLRDSLLLEEILREVGATYEALRNQLHRDKEEIMASFDDLKAKQDVTDAKIAAVATDVTTLLAKLAAIPTAGMTPEQQAALDAAVVHASAINDSLTAVDTSANPPAPAAPAV